MPETTRTEEFLLQEADGWLGRVVGVAVFALVHRHGTDGVDRLHVPAQGEGRRRQRGDGVRSDGNHYRQASAPGW